MDSKQYIHNDITKEIEKQAILWLMLFRSQIHLKINVHVVSIILQNFYIGNQCTHY
jgi:hypothetical protein